VAEEVQEGIFREIDEELRQEHYAKLWRRYGKVVIAAAVLLVAGVAGYQGWRSWDANMRKADGERFAAAQALARAQDPSGAEAAFAKLAGDASGGYALEHSRGLIRAHSPDRDDDFVSHQRSNVACS